MHEKMTVSEAFSRAHEKQREFAFDQAEMLYRAILDQSAPLQPVAYNLCAMLLAQGRVDEAHAVAARLPVGDAEAAGRLKRLADGVAAAVAEQPRWLGTVAIPAYNAAGRIAATLDSVLVAIRTLQQKATPQRVMISIADDASSDGTGEACLAWAAAAGFDDLVLSRHGANRGAAAARNTAAGAGRGELLWFLDSDDAYRPDHLAVHWALLSDRPEVGYSRSGLIFDDIDAQVTPEWRLANEHTHTINLCVRRSCHEFIGGLREDAVFRRSGGEDAAYAEMLADFFVGIYSDRPTAFYRRRPGNALDQQVARFTAGDAPPQPEQATDDFALQQLIGVVLRTRETYLRHRQSSRQPPVKAQRWPREMLAIRTNARPASL